MNKQKSELNKMDEGTTIHKDGAKIINSNTQNDQKDDNQESKLSAINQNQAINKNEPTIFNSIIQNNQTDDNTVQIINKQENETSEMNDIISMKAQNIVIQQKGIKRKYEDMENKDEQLFKEIIKKKKNK